jgi:hypothetical protein
VGNIHENSFYRPAPDGCGAKYCRKASRPSIPCTPCFLSLAGASKYARLKWHTVGQFPPAEGFHSLINTLIGKVFGTKNERVIKTMMPKVEAINALEPQMQ